MKADLQPDSRSTLADAIPLIAWVAAADGRAVYFNRRWYEYTGLTEVQSLGDGWASALHPDDLDRCIGSWRVATSRGTPYQVEHRLRRADGSHRWHSGRVLPECNASGAIVGWFGTCTDVEELLNRIVQDRTRDLTRSNADLARFAAEASHDLEEPLRKIRGFADRLAARPVGTLDAQAQEYAARIVAAADRMRSLIREILESSRAMGVDRPHGPVDLAQLVVEAVMDLEELKHRTGGRVEVGQLPKIRADPIQMRRLFQNLIGNALKFHRPGVPPTVSVESRRLPGSSDIELTVSDDGIGFDGADLGCMFEAFGRPARSVRFEGTGLGLAICRQIVERHSGTITAHSRPGEGSTFTIVLPQPPRAVDASQAGESALPDGASRS